MKELKEGLQAKMATPALPNDIDLNLLSQLLAYSDRYEISIQFWPDQTAVYIQKKGVDLKDYGGSFEFAIGKSLEYLNRINQS